MLLWGNTYIVEAKLREIPSRQGASWIDRGWGPSGPVGYVALSRYGPSAINKDQGCAAADCAFSERYANRFVTHGHGQLPSSCIC